MLVFCENQAMKATHPALGDTLDVDAATTALAKLESWNGLSGSSRLRSILRYIVTEALQGRAAQLRAKTIAFDVYGYTAEELVGRESVVRVDAGRLRRKLREYADGPGAADPFHILLEKGSYAPVFVVSAKPKAEEPQENPAKLKLEPRWIAVLALCAIVLAALVARFGPDKPPVSSPVVTITPTQRGAIFETSPERLSAINLSEDGRNLIFPALDPNRLRAALQVFQAAIDTDAEYFGGYAGIAQVQATMSILVQDPERSTQALGAAQAALQRARNLAPGDAWTESAHAWVSFAEKDYDTAKRLSERAVSLDPDSRYVLEFDALISLFTGDFDRVLSETRRFRSLNNDTAGSVFMNAAGSALFHTGDYRGTLELFTTAIELGGPIGPASLAYMMAAHQKLGNADRARQLAEQFEKNWPGSSFDTVFGGLFMDETYAEELVTAMRSAGWQVLR